MKKKEPELMLSLYFKRAKLFLGMKDGAEVRFQAGIGGPWRVPYWVKSDPGYELGVKDGSIVDITPPRAVLMAEAKREEEEKKAAAVEAAGEEEEDNVEMPVGFQPPLTGQPSKSRAGAARVTAATAGRK